MLTREGMNGRSYGSERRKSMLGMGRYREGMVEGTRLIRSYVGQRLRTVDHHTRGRQASRLIQHRRWYRMPVHCHE